MFSGRFRTKSRARSTARPRTATTEPAATSSSTASVSTARRPSRPTSSRRISRTAWALDGTRRASPAGRRQPTAHTTQTTPTPRWTTTTAMPTGAQKRRLRRSPRAAMGATGRTRTRITCESERLGPERETKCDTIVESTDGSFHWTGFLQLRSKYPINFKPSQETSRWRPPKIFL